MSSGPLSYSILPAERLEEALSFMETHFYPSNGICGLCRALNVSKNRKAMEELNHLCSACINDGVSVVAVENKSNRIVGVAVNKLQEKPSKPETPFFEKFSKSEFKEKESITLINTLISCKSTIDPFQALNVEKLIEIVFLGVLPEYRDQDVAVELVNTTLQQLDNASADENGPKAVVALFMSEHMQDIGKSLDFEVLSTLSLATFSCEGMKFSDKLGSAYKTAKVYARRHGAPNR